MTIQPTQSTALVEIHDRGGARADPWLFAMLPAALVLLAVFALPLIYLGANSLHPNVGLGQVGEEYTLANYERFFGDPFYLTILLRTFMLGAIVTAVCVVLAFPMAYFL